MTPMHTDVNCPALPITAVGRTFSFSFRPLLLNPAVRTIRETQIVAQEIHNMNALDHSVRTRVHIMNFIVANQKLPDEIHIMNFMKSEQVEPPSVRRKTDGAGKAGLPST